MEEKLQPLQYQPLAPTQTQSGLRLPRPPMIVSSLRLPTPQWLGSPAYSLRSSKLNPPTILLCFSASSSLSSPPSSPSAAAEAETSPPPPSNDAVHLHAAKWTPFRKKKVVMRVGYVGTDYRGQSPPFCHLQSLLSFFFFSHSTRCSF